MKIASLSCTSSAAAKNVAIDAAKPIKGGPMLSALAAIFVISYAAIALEHPIGINKSASALLGAGLLWTVYAMMSGDYGVVAHKLDESVASTAQIIFFLLGAMTIVEVIDA